MGLGLLSALGAAGFSKNGVNDGEVRNDYKIASNFSVQRVMLLWVVVVSFFRFIMRKSKPSKTLLLIFAFGMIQPNMATAKVTMSDPAHYLIEEYFSQWSDAYSACVAFAESHGYGGWYCSYAPGASPVWGGNFCESYYNCSAFYFGDFYIVPCPTGQKPNRDTGTCELIVTSNPLKNLAESQSCLLRGNPINIGTGNKYQPESDYQGGGDFPLVFDRYYNSDPSAVSASFSAASGWRHTYERSITRANGSSTITAYRADGKSYNFDFATKLPDADVNLQLSGSNTTGWQLTTEDGGIETYDVSGKLRSIKSRSGETQTLTNGANGLVSTVTDTSGRTLTFGYDSYFRLISVTDPAGGIYQYGYDANGNLVTVTYPDNAIRTYVYNEPANMAVSLPHALTGIIDENGSRYATWTYDGQGRATSSQHAGGASYVGVSYGTNNSTVTDALGTSRTTSLQAVQGVIKSGGQSQPAGAGCSASAANVSYDANGNIASRTDFNGNVSCYAYDLNRNLETARVEGMAPGSSCPADLGSYTPAANSSERKIATQWHASYRLPVQIDQAGQRQSFSYDVAGNLLQKTVTDTATQQSRSWSYTYNNIGQVLTEDGPRTDVNDVTSYSYYGDSTADHKPGDLWKITNALGHVTTFTAYDANGRPLSITDPNGLVFTLAYDARQRLVSFTAGSETTAYTYDPAGLVTRITRPDGAFLDYTYDAAHRLIKTQDNLGNSLVYTLDAMGNRVKEDMFDPGGQLARSQSRIYDALSRLQNLIQLQ